MEINSNDSNKNEPKTYFEGLQIFLPCLKEIKNLTCLSLTFSEFHKLSDEEVYLLALIGCNHLETLALDFWLADQLTNKCFSHLQFGLQELTTLKRLDLIFKESLNLI